MSKTYRIQVQLSILRDVAKEYAGRTIENIIAQLEARKMEMEKQEEAEG